MSLRNLPARLLTLCKAAVLVAGAILTAIPPAAAQTQVEGHRGARGVLPENTLAAFQHALEIGVDVLELDTGLTRDGVVVVAHDPALNPDLIRKRDTGAWVAPGLWLYNLDFAELKGYEAGVARPESSVVRRFPQQRNVPGAAIPALREVFDLVRRANNTAVRFNIETKIRPASTSKTAPPEVMAKALADTIAAAGMTARSTVQSFDWRTLRYLREHVPALKLAALTAEQRWLDTIARGQPGPSPWTAGLDIDAHDGSVPRMVKALGANVWSPYYKDITAALVNEAHALGLEVAVWTVNNIPDLRHMLALGVDSIITDYPERLIKLLRTRGDRP